MTTPVRPSGGPVTHHRTTKVDEVNIFYREAGPANAPVVLLLHARETPEPAGSPRKPLHRRLAGLGLGRCLRRSAAIIGM